MKTNTLHEEMPRYTEQDVKENIIIKLKNFRSYTSAEIRIPLNSTTLISGPSGAGKTTILEAFIFGMYDGVNKPEKFQTKRVIAWIFIQDLIIYRQKDPICFVVWKRIKEVTANNVIKESLKQYVGDEAQEVVNSIYGNQSVFLSTSYLRQKEFSPFLSGTDTEKLQIIKDVAFKGSESDDIKGPIKIKSQELAEQYTMIKAQLDMAIRSVQSFDTKNPNVVQYQIPENGEEVMARVKDLRLQMTGLDKEFETAARLEANASVYKQQVDLSKSRQDQLLAHQNQININAVRARMQEVDAKLKEFTDVSFDVEKIAKAHIFKQWTNDRIQLAHNDSNMSNNLNVVSAAIKQTFPEAATYTNDADLLKFVTETKAKLTEISTAMTAINLLLTHANAKTIDEAKSNLAQTEKNLLEAQDKETSVRTDLDRAKILIEKVRVRNEEARIKAEQELLEAKTREKEREKEREEKEREKEKKRADDERARLEKHEIESRERETKLRADMERSIKAEQEKIRLSNKMSCPQCHTELVIGEDGKSLKRCHEAPSGIGAMLGNVSSSTKTPSAIIPTAVIPSNTSTSTSNNATLVLAPTTLTATPSILSPAPSLLSPATSLSPATFSPAPTLLSPAPSSSPLSSATSIFSLSGPATPAVAAPVVAAMVEKIEIPNVTADDLARAAAHVSMLIQNRDRLVTIIQACEEKFKQTMILGQVKTQDGLNCMHHLTKYIELSATLISVRNQLMEHDMKRPEQISEKVADLKEKEKIDTEKAGLEKKIEYYGHLARDIASEEEKHQLYVKTFMEIISNKGRSASDITKAKGDMQANIDQLMHLSSATQLIGERNILEKTMREKAAMAEHIEKIYQASQRLLVKATEAERIYLQTAVDKINVLLGKSLQKLFPDVPISVQINTTRELKTKGKGGVAKYSQRFDIKIFYRDSEYDNSKQLSGGERDRVSLAITLAMSETFGSPILFLDETLSSLDSELKSEAVALLKEMCTTKTCVVISHEETEGLYDNILRLKE